MPGHPVQVIGQDRLKHVAYDILSFSLQQLAMLGSAHSTIEKTLDYKAVVLGSAIKKQATENGQKDKGHMQNSSYDI